MLAGDAGFAGEAAPAATALSADWSGFLISDLNGNVMVADVEGAGRADTLATTSVALFDIAISPSGRVFGVAGPADGSSILYELEVDFDNPGGFVNPVQIGWVATNNSGVRLNGLEFAADGTLLATGCDYPSLFEANYLYSLDEDSADATRLVNLGSYDSAGDVTADEDGNVYLTTLSGHLLRIPSDHSGYAVVGNLGYSDIYGMTYGPGPELRGYRTNGEVLNIDPSDASWEHEITLWPGNVSAPNSLLGATTIFKPPTNLGVVDFVDLADQSAFGDELWYCFDAMYDGWVTVELDDFGSPGGLDLRLYLRNDDGGLTEVADETSRVDYEAEAGDRFYVELNDLAMHVTVRICNLVEQEADSITVHGTDESDDLVLEVDSPYVVDVNGIDYELSFPGGTLVTTTFDGGGGSDSIGVLGSDGDDTVEIDMATLAGAISGANFAVEFSSTAMMEFDGREGYDTAQIQGTDADSQLNLGPFQGELVEGVVHGSVLQMEEIAIDAADGDDDVTFDGGTKADRLDLDPTSGLYREYVPEGESRDPTYRISATNIESNYASSGGGIDAVFMRDSPGDETFIAGLGLVRYEGPGYSHEIHGFRIAHAYGLNGGHDRATIYDTMQDDKFKGKDDISLLRGGSFYFRAKGFEEVESTALYGGNDLAVLYGTAGDDLLTSSYESTRMAGGGVTRTVSGFTQVLAHAAGGYDVARLQDSPGRDEFRGRSHKVTFRSLDDDLLNVTARAFDAVYAEASFGGADIAKLHDTAGDDYLSGTGNVGRLSTVGGGSLDLLYEATAFETVKVYWTTGSHINDLEPPLDYAYYEVFL